MAGRVCTCVREGGRVKDRCLLCVEVCRPVKMLKLAFFSPFAALKKNHLHVRVISCEYFPNKLEVCAATSH